MGSGDELRYAPAEDHSSTTFTSYDDAPAEPTVKKEKEADPHGPYKMLLRDLGVETERVDGLLFERMKLLDDETNTLDDERNAIRRLEQVNDRCRETTSANALSEDELTNAEIASLLTDSGKTGPKDATPEQIHFIASIYDIEAPIKPHPGAVTLEQFLQEHFARSLNDVLDTARSLQLKPSMTMREFFDLHAGWSYDIMKSSVDKGGIPAEAALAAATHHILEDVNPGDIFDRETGAFQAHGIDRQIGKVEMWVILMDKYDACRRRGKKNHAEAIAWLTDFVEKPRGKTVDVLQRLPYLKELYMSCLKDLEQTELE